MQARRFRIVFLVCLSALALVPIVPAYLPLVDFPQHVALHAIWNNIADPAFHQNGRFRVTLSTPYALPHLAAHAVARFLGPEGGLRAILVLSLVAFPLAALVLLRAFDRPPEIALAAFPAALSFVYWYGFISYVMSLPLILLGIALARRCAASGRPRDGVLLALLALLTVATNAFAFLVLLLLGGVAAIATTRALSRLALVAGALAPGLLWSVIWTVASSAEPSAEPLETSYGPLRERLQILLGSAFGSYTRDARVLTIALASAAILAAALWLSRRPAPAAGDERARRALGLVAIAAICASLLCPQIFMNTWGLWERIPPVAFVVFAGALRWPGASETRARLGAALAAVALFASGTALAQGLAFSEQAKGIRELAQDLPTGARVMWTACGEEKPWRTATPSFKHLGAYVQAARGGDLSYSFAHFHHMVVRYRGARLPQVFDPAVYDFALLRLGPRCPSMEELRKLGPVAVRGRYVAFAAAAVTPELAAALAPERFGADGRSAARGTR
ncbi:MAG: hypothetical protein ACJ79H_20020 [Myxococcales bacterium]